MKNKKKNIHHFPFPHDVNLNSPSIFGKRHLNFRCMTPWRFIQNSHFLCTRKQYSLAYLEDFSPSDLDYNINYTDPSYSEQNMGR
jgi:hypothetical protein